MKLYYMNRTLALMLAGVTVLASTAFGAVVFNDDFATQATGNNVNDLGWYYYGDGGFTSTGANSLPGTPDDNYMSLLGSASSVPAGVYKDVDFKPGNTLEVGERLSLSVVVVGSANMANVASRFRLFLGTRGDSPATLEDSGAIFSASSDREGYLFRMATGNNTGGGNIGHYDADSSLLPELLGGPVTGDETLYNPGFGLPRAESYSYAKTLTLQFERLNSTDMRITGSYDYFTDTFYEFTSVTLTNTSFAFDTLGIGMAYWENNREIRFSNVTLEYLPVTPEPSTLLLAMMGLFMLWRSFGRSVRTQ